MYSSSQYICTQDCKFAVNRCFKSTQPAFLLLKLKTLIWYFFFLHVKLNIHIVDMLHNSYSLEHKVHSLSFLVYGSVEYFFFLRVKRKYREVIVPLRFGGTFAELFSGNVRKLSWSSRARDTAKPLLSLECNMYITWTLYKPSSI